MKLPPHTATPSDVRGYERIDWLPPSAGLPQVFSFARPAGSARLDAIDRNSTEFRERVAAIASAQAALKPWTLLAMPGEGFSIVAIRRTAWMRVVTWWRNRSRRHEAAEARKRMAAYFAPENVAARTKASQQ